MPCDRWRSSFQPRPRSSRLEPNPPQGPAMPVCRVPSGPKGQDSEYSERRRGGAAGGQEERRGHKRPRSQLSGGPGGGGGGWSPPGGGAGAQSWGQGAFVGPPSINIPSTGAYGYSSPRPNQRYPHQVSGELGTTTHRYQTHLTWSHNQLTH